MYRIGIIGLGNIGEGQSSIGYCGGGVLSFAIQFQSHN